MFLPIILAGGSGSRLWPLSRESHPKQLISVLGNQTMLQHTVSRLKGFNFAKPIVVCNQEYRFLVAEQMRNIHFDCDILLEPVARNTAPAIALAALKVLQSGDDPVLLVLPADHEIKNIPQFESAIEKGISIAEQGKFVTLGVVPKSAETGYGYIKRGDTVDGESFSVAQFTEKPDLLIAQEFLSSGEYYWNSGVFIFKASRYLQALEKYHPNVIASCQKSINSTFRDLDFIRVDMNAFSDCPEISIDYAIMEPLCCEKNGQPVVVIPLDADWHDIGSWSALWENGEKDIDDNCTSGDVLIENSRGCLVQAEERLVALLGLQNVIVVDTKDALLVAQKEEVQNVRNLVNKLKLMRRREWQYHREVFRPWGKYDVIDTGNHYQVKRITVNPGAKLSLQIHRHRAEHWVVISGIAKVTNGEHTFNVSQNESTFIPIGQLHALENPGIVPLELIEVQTGEYLGEDDIVRFDDRYGREIE